MVSVITFNGSVQNKVLEYFSSLNIDLEVVKFSDLKSLKLECKNRFFLCEVSEMSVFDFREVTEFLETKDSQVFRYTFNSGSLCEVEDECILHLPMTKPQLISNLKVLRNFYVSKKKNEILENFLNTRSRLINLGELTASVMHDLNNFTMVASASFEGIKFAVDKNSCLTKIDRFCHIGKKSINELMRISSKCDSFLNGADTIRIEEISIFEICEWIEDIFKAEFTRYNIELKISVNPEIVIKSDRSVIMQSLLNLVKNSISAIKNKLDHKWIEVGLIDSTDGMTLEVSDSGTMCSSMTDHLFDINKSSNSKDGHGLGLYLVRKRLSELNINIDVTLNPNTTFFIELPRDIVSYQNTLGSSLSIA